MGNSVSRLATLSSALAIIVLAFATGIPVPAEEKIKVGVPVPLSGEMASWGRDLQNAAAFANRELFGGRYELLFEDDGCDPQRAVTAARKYIDLDKIKYALGFACSGALLAPASLYDRAGVVAITSSAASGKISGLSRFIFRTFPTNASGARVMSDYLKGRHSRLGILSEESEFPLDYLSALKSRLPPGACISETYPPVLTDFRPLLLRLRQAGVEALLMNTQSEGGLNNILRQLEELRWSIPRYGNISPGSPRFLDLAGSLADGIIFNDVPALESALNLSGEGLYSRYKQEFGGTESTPILFGTTVAAFQALDAAIRSSRPVEEYLKSAVFDTVIGRISFDAQGDISGLSQVLKIVRDRSVENLSVN